MEGIAEEREKEGRTSGVDVVCWVCLGLDLYTGDWCHGSSQGCLDHLWGSFSHLSRCWYRGFSGIVSPWPAIGASVAIWNFSGASWVHVVCLSTVHCPKCWSNKSSHRTTGSGPDSCPWPDATVVDVLRNRDPVGEMVEAMYKMKKN